MAVVDKVQAANELRKIWNELTGCSIAFEIFNDMNNEVEVIESIQGTGTRKGSWDDIPAGMVEECGTQHHTVFGTGNNGGVAYKVAVPGGTCYLGIVWSDPSIGKSYYGYAISMNNETYVTDYVKKWGDSFFKTSLPISGGTHLTLNSWGCDVVIQPGFDPFKVTIDPLTSAADSSEPAQASVEPIAIDVQSPITLEDWKVHQLRLLQEAMKDMK